MVINTHFDLFIVQINSIAHDSNKQEFTGVLLSYGISGKFCSKNFALMNKYEVKLP